MREVCGEGCRYPQARSGRHAGGVYVGEGKTDVCIPGMVVVGSPRREREAIRQLGSRERRKVREGGGANDYMKGMGRQTDEGPGGKPKDQAMFPAWVGFGRSPLRGIPVSLNPKTPGWRAGMCVWLRQQAVLLVCLNRPASRPSGGRGQ